MVLMYFLGEIITDLEMYDDDNGNFEELMKHKECGECDICFGECPTKSINPNGEKILIYVYLILLKKRI